MLIADRLPRYLIEHQITTRNKLSVSNKTTRLPRSVAHLNVGETKIKYFDLYFLRAKDYNRRIRFTV